jgi:hypothetical protein
MKNALWIALAISLVPTFLLEMWRFTAVFLVLFLIFALVVVAISFVFRKPTARITFWLGSALMISFFFFCSISSEKQPRVLMRFTEGYYNRVAEGLMHRQLSVVELPDPKLLALSNPYVRSNRDGINTLWDLSLYHGKYYVYWGIAPVLVFHFPIHYFTGAYVSEWFACFFFASFAFLFCALFLRRALRDWFQIELDAAETLLLILALGFSSTFPYVLRRPAVYENAIVAGVGFLFLSLYLLLLAMQKQKNWMKNIFFVGAGLTFGAAVGSRPGFLVAGAIYFLLLGQYFLKNRSKSNLIAFLVPTALCGILLAEYNYHRFDSYFEFGLRYQLSLVDLRVIHFKFADVWNGWKAYLLNLPRVQFDFPFFKVERIHVGLGQSHSIMNDEVLGMVWAAPILWAISLLGFREIRAKMNSDFFRIFFVFSVVTAILITVDSISGIQERYTTDFSVLIQIPALLLFFQLSRVPGIRYRAIQVFFTCMIVFGFTLNLFTSFTGNENRFVNSRPELYSDLSVIFSGR